MLTRRGTNFDDTMRATSTSNESFLGLAGDDDFFAFSGDRSDKFYGGDGNDRLFGFELSTNRLGLIETDNRSVFDGGIGFDEVMFLAAVLSSTTILQLSKVNFVLNDVERIGFDFTFDTRANQIVSLVGSTKAELVVIADIGFGSIEMTARLGAGNDQFRTNFLTEFSSLVLRMGSGQDRILLGSSADGAELYGEAGDDVMSGSAYHRENIFGGIGDDTVIIDNTGGRYVDTIHLGAGNDAVVLDQVGSFLVGPRSQIVDFRPNFDRIVIADDNYSGANLYFSGQTTRFTIDLVIDNRNGELRTASGEVLIDFGGPTSLRRSNFVFEDDFYFNDFFR